MAALPRTHPDVAASTLLTATSLDALHPDSRTSACPGHTRRGSIRRTAGLVAAMPERPPRRHRLEGSNDLGSAGRRSAFGHRQRCETRGRVAGAIKLRTASPLVGYRSLLSNEPSPPSRGRRTTRGGGWRLSPSERPFACMRIERAFCVRSGPTLASTNVERCSAADSERLPFRKVEPRGLQGGRAFSSPTAVAARLLGKLRSGRSGAYLVGGRSAAIMKSATNAANLGSDQPRLTTSAS